MNLGAKGDGAGKAARIGAAAHGKGRRVLARHLVVDIDERAYRRRIRRGVEGLDGVIDRKLGTEALGHRATGGLELTQVDAVGQAHVDGLLYATILDLDSAAVAGKRAKRLVFGSDAQRLAGGIGVDHREELQDARLGAGTDTGLAQIVQHQLDGVQRALGHGGMAADAVGRDARAAGFHRLDLQTVRMRRGRRQRTRIDSDLADRLGGNGVCGLGTAPQENTGVLAQLLGDKGCAKLTLLGVADRELRIGGKEKRGVLMAGQIVADVVHARLLVRAQQRTEGIARLDALVQQICTGIESQNGRALVVDHASAEQPSVATLHRERIGVPTGARGHHVNVRDGRDLALALARDVGHAHVAVVMRGLVTEFGRDLERAVESGTGILAKRCARLVRALNGNGGHGDELGDICQNAVPDLIHVRVDARFQILIHM